ncbi:hypothetical protein ACQPUY_03740 [Clostridium nigeriense]|uniref:hypothetical protein n=1 Tax=Clostridium nigeriense TaxID=1805470 RepID=UPI003D327138
MLNSTVLSSKDITEIINLKGKEKGIEVTHIEINKGIVFSGKIFTKMNSNFSGIVYIKRVCDNKIMLETRDLNISKFGILKGASVVILKTLVKILGDDYIRIKGNDIIINLEKYSSDIKDVYIKDKLLYIIGTDLEIYLNA